MKDVGCESEILALLNLKEEDIHRFTSAWLDLDREEIKIYTGCGVDHLLDHELYIRNEVDIDDGEVVGYIYYFKFPNSLRKLVEVAE
jgi:hypothetical protein